MIQRVEVIVDGVHAGWQRGFSTSCDHSRSSDWASSGCDCPAMTTLVDLLAPIWMEL